MLRFLLPLLFICSLGTGARAQMDAPRDLQALLDSFGVELVPPPATYKTLPPHPNDYLTDQFRTLAREDKLEIRLAFQREFPDDRMYDLPHLVTGLLVTNLSSNDEDVITTVHRFDEEEMGRLRADWAALHTFRPKRSFSGYRHAQLVTLYRAGFGYVQLVLCFDRAPATLDAWHTALRFVPPAG